MNLRLPLSTVTRDANNQHNLAPVLFGGLLAAAFFWLAKVAIESLLVGTNLSPSAGYFLTILGGLVGGVTVYLAWAKMCNLEQWQLIRVSKAGANNEER